MAHNKKNHLLFYPLNPAPKFCSTDTGLFWLASYSDISIQICVSKSPQKKSLEGKL